MKEIHWALNQKTDIFYLSLVSLFFINFEN